MGKGKERKAPFSPSLPPEPLLSYCPTATARRHIPLLKPRPLDLNKHDKLGTRARASLCDQHKKQAAGSDTPSHPPEHTQ